MTSAELTEWLAFDLIEPFGGHRADDRARLLATIAYNAGRGEGSTPLAPADFLKVYEDPDAAEAAKLAAMKAFVEG